MDLSKEIVKLKSNQASMEARATGQDTSATVDGGATDRVRNINQGCSVRYSSNHSERQNGIINRPISSDSYQHVNTVTFGGVCTVSASNLGETRRKILFQHISDASLEFWCIDIIDSGDIKRIEVDSRCVRSITKKSKETVLIKLHSPPRYMESATDWSVPLPDYGSYHWKARNYQSFLAEHADAHRVGDPSSILAIEIVAEQPFSMRHLENL